MLVRVNFLKMKSLLLKNSTLISAISIFLVLLLSFSFVATAADDLYGLNTTAENAGLAGGPTDLAVIIGNFIRYVLGLIGLILLVLIVFGGFLWMTSAGSEEKIKKAKGIITNAVLGLIIVLAAYAITWFVMTRLTGAMGLGPEGEAVIGE